MFRSWLQFGFLLNFAMFGVIGCVSRDEQADFIESDLEPAHEDYDPELDLRFAEQAWQRDLNTDIGQVEDAAESFIQSASDLYDLLIEAQQSQIQQRITAIDASLKQSTLRHAALVASVERLLQRIQQDDVRSAVNKIPMGANEHREVCEALSRFRHRDSKAVSYQSMQGRLLTSVAFGDNISADAGLAKVDPAQRDALALLDYLRFTSNSLASVSGTVTQWVVQTNPDKHPQGLTLESLSH